jgi:hypothetical protein
MDGLFVAYSTWPTLPTATHWLIDNAEATLEAKTMQLIAPAMRDEKLLLMYKGLFDEHLRSLLLAEDAAVSANRAEFMGRVVE